MLDEEPYAALAQRLGVSFTVEQKGKRARVRLPAGYDGWGGTCAGMERLRKTGVQVGTSPNGGGGIVSRERAGSRRRAGSRSSRTAWRA